MDDKELNETSGVSAYAEAYGSSFANLTKAVKKLGALKNVSVQVDQMNMVTLKKQLDDIQRLSEESLRLANFLVERTAAHRMAVSETDQREWTDLFRANLSTQRTVEGDFPQFLVFPIEIRVDFANDQVLINKKITRKLHPKAVADAVERELNRVYAERFNPQQFMKVLLRAFDLLIAEAGTNNVKTQSVPLTEVYKLLTLRAGSSSYSAVQFAFDIYRFRRQEDRSLNGRRVTFGASKNRSGYIIPRQGRDPEVLGSLEVTGPESAP